MFDLQKLLVDIEADNIGMHAYQRGEKIVQKVLQMRVVSTEM